MTNEELVRNKLPQTGRIGRFIKILDMNSEKDDALFILKDANNYNSREAEEKSYWWLQTVERMELSLGPDKSKKIMNECGSKCCGKGQRTTARKLFLSSGSILDFLDIISHHDVREGDLTYTLEDENTIIAVHNKCFCKQVAKANLKFPNLTYCQCSVSFNRLFFSSAFNKEVDVELTQSIIHGDKYCKFIITF